MQKGISDDNWDTPYSQAVRSEMKEQAVNSTINRARRAKQLQGLLKHSICLGHRTVIAVRLQLGRCLWALNEILDLMRTWIFCRAFLQHQTLNWFQGWSPHSRRLWLGILCVAGFLGWAGQLVPAVGSGLRGFVNSHLFNNSWRLSHMGMLFCSVVEMTKTPIKAQCQHLVISLLSKISGP